MRDEAGALHDQPSLCVYVDADQGGLGKGKFGGVARGHA
jgi:hypothetical protein